MGTHGPIFPISFVMAVRRQSLSKGTPLLCRRKVTPALRVKQRGHCQDCTGSDRATERLVRRISDPVSALWKRPETQQYESPTELLEKVRSEQPCARAAVIRAQERTSGPSRAFIFDLLPWSESVLDRVPAFPVLL